MRGMRVYCRVAPKSTSCGRFTTSAKSCRRIHYHHRLRNLISLREHPMKHMHSTSQKVSLHCLPPPSPSRSLFLTQSLIFGLSVSWDVHSLDYQTCSSACAQPESLLKCDEVLLKNEGDGRQPVMSSRVNHVADTPTCDRLASTV